MIADSNVRKSPPWGWIGAIPLYITTLLVIGYCVAMVIEAILRATGMADVNYWLLFNPGLTIYHFQFWRIFTYPFLNEPSIWFLMEMGMLYFLGREVEQYMGHKNFMWFYFALIIIPAIFITILQFFGIYGLSLVGSWNINFAVFISFVALYPHAEVFFGIAIKWVAIALAGIRSLEFLEQREWIPLMVFLVECCAAVFLIRAIRSGAFQSVENFCRQWVSSQKIKRNVRTMNKLNKKAQKADSCNSVDLILEKISREGISSLTPIEREYLEKARVALLEKERQL